MSKLLTEMPTVMPPVKPVSRDGYTEWIGHSVRAAAARSREATSEIEQLVRGLETPCSHKEAVC